MRMNKKFKYSLLLFWMMLQAFNYGYSQVNDAQLWTTVGIEKKISKKFSAAFNQEFRFNENITELGTFFSDIGVAYKPHKNWRIEAHYRFCGKKLLDNSYSFRHRYYFDLAYRKKFYAFTVMLRERFQSQYADVNTSEDGHIPSYYSRTKLSLKYNVTKRIAPYLYSEIFIPLNNPQIKGIDNTRYGLGLEYEFIKNSTLDLSFTYQRESLVKNPERDFIFGLGYTFSF